jgi:hypothetical protein
MSVSIKKSALRSEIRTIKGKSKTNYLVIRFWDDNNQNWEYHVYAEVIAKQAVRDIGKRFGYNFPVRKDPNSRTLWDKVWAHI